ncbi:hypothetical protein B0H10DRAFT_2005382 [Mycena sp. CBHHK59/15]|nr:hypothetical protein B0H10DRAFT_2005382 [Mycena sp. CBHHK59/15]
MRLKIQSVPPLPALKVWFTPGEQCITVANLKSALAREVPELKLKSVSPLELTLDGFGLLDASLLLDVLRDGDLVLVKASETLRTTNEAGKKRKRSTSPIPHGRTKTRSLPPPLPDLSPVSSSSSSSSSSSPSSSSSSSSSSDEDSDSDSSSSSSSSSSASPPTSVLYKNSYVLQTQTARRSTVRPPTITTTTSTVARTTTVPPGKGKSSTHSRNIRRRMKKLATASVSASLPSFVSTTNATPILNTETMEDTEEQDRKVKARRGRIHGPAPNVASALNNAFGGNETAGRLDPGPLDITAPSASYAFHPSLHPPTEAEKMLNTHMMSMVPKSKNKNKSRSRAKGGEEVDPRSRKIVFGSPLPLPVQDLSYNEPEEEQTPRMQGHRLVAPSMLPPHLIPSNVFVTCVDVEEGMKKTKKKKRRVEEQEENWYMEEAPPEDSTVLDYGEEATELPIEPTKHGCLVPSMFNFDSAPLITSHEQLSIGSIIGFSGLAFNFKTRAPEIGKLYGRVLSWTDADDRYMVTIRPLFEDGEEEVEPEETGEEAEGGPREEYEWEQVNGVWKLLQ